MHFCYKGIFMLHSRLTLNRDKLTRVGGGVVKRFQNCLQVHFAEPRGSVLKQGSLNAGLPRTERKLFFPAVFCFALFEKGKVEGSDEAEIYHLLRPNLILAFRTAQPQTDL